MGEHRRKLIRNYEDAKLALLLDEYAVAYGKVSTRQYEEDLAAGKIKEIPDRDLDAQLEAILRRAEAEESRSARFSTQFKRITRKAAVVAASIAVFFLLMVSVQAAGIDIFGAVGRWTDSLFHFESAFKENSGLKSDVADQNQLVIADIRKTLLLNDFSAELSPSWLPKNMIVIKTSPTEYFGAPGISLLLEDSTGNWMLYQIDSSSEAGSVGVDWIEKDEGNVETIQSNNREFYIFLNNEVWTAVCQSEDYRITIVNSSGKDDLTHIIQSIGGQNND